jgi:hypothetical protein
MVTMNDVRAGQVSNVMLILAIVLAVIQVWGMLQEPKPEWTRIGAVPISTLLIIGAVLRRRVRRNEREHHT